jgi:ankyrin repeat protein
MKKKKFLLALMFQGNKFLEIKLKITKMLIQFKSDINARDTSNWTPLHLAASVGSPAIMELLVSPTHTLFSVSMML